MPRRSGAKMRGIPANETQMRELKLFTSVGRFTLKVRMLGGQGGGLETCDINVNLKSR